MADLLGIDRRINKENQDYQNLITGIIPSNADIVLHNRLRDVKSGDRNNYGYEVDRIVGTYFPKFREMVDEMSDEDIQDSPARFKILLGKLQHKEKGKPTKEYSSMYDKSRWKFFLDAPFEISNLCCKVMKKEPVRRYGKETGRVPMTAQMASESKLRTQQWLKNGCNAFDSKKPISNPMSFWTEQDVLLYIKTYNIPIASVYGDVVVDYEGMGQIEGQMSIADFMDATGKEEFDLDRPLLKTTGCNRTGCVLCAYGCHLEKGESRFEQLKKTHPKHYALLDKLTNSGVTYREAIDWINEHNGKGTIIRY